MKFEKQVDRTHYDFTNYVYPSRWMSYYCQIQEIASRNDIHSMLDIGPGTAFMKRTLEVFVPEVEYTSLDIAPDVGADVEGSVTHIPLDDAAVDLVCAFQILEHIPYEDIPNALSEIQRVSRKYVFISLPHFGPSIEVSFKIPFIPRIKCATKLPFPKKHVFNGQHYWEVGKYGYAPVKIRSLIQKYFKIINEYVPFENQYHRFYILEKKDD